MPAAAAAVVVVGDDKGTLMLCFVTYPVSIARKDPNETFEAIQLGNM